MPLSQTEIKLHANPIVTSDGTVILGECGMGDIEFVDLRREGVPYIDMVGMLMIGENNGSHVKTFRNGAERNIQTRSFTMNRVTYAGYMTVGVSPSARSSMNMNRMFGSPRPLLEIEFTHLRRTDKSAYSDKWGADQPTDTAQEKLKGLVENIFRETSHPWGTQPHPSKAAREYTNRMKADLQRAVSDKMAYFVRSIPNTIPLSPENMVMYFNQIHDELQSSLLSTFEESFQKHDADLREYTQKENDALPIRRELSSDIESFKAGKRG